MPRCEAYPGYKDRNGPTWGPFRRIRSDSCSELQVGCPVRLDLLHQFLRQRHVVQRSGLRAPVGVGPAEELLRAFRTGGILRLLVYEAEVGVGTQRCPGAGG